MQRMVARYWNNDIKHEKIATHILDDSNSELLVKLGIKI